MPGETASGSLKNAITQRKVGESMIQIDMPMPKNCLDCPACNEYLTCAIPVNGRKWGENDVREYGQCRPEWCPMKEQEAEAIKKIKEPVFSVYGGICPKCRNWIQSAHSFCGFCGQAVKWE